MENNRNLRNIILNMLMDTLEKGEFSHIVINRVFADQTLSARDRSFINRAYSGTLERLVYIDHIIGCFSSLPLKKLKPVIRNILRMSVYQLKFMDSVPAHSCIDEAVKLTRKRGLSNLSGFVNGILRKVQRESDDLKLPGYVEVSLPEWFYNMMIEQYGPDDAAAFFKGRFDDSGETTVRFNLLRSDIPSVIASLEADGCKVRRLEDIPSAAAISGFKSLTDLKAFKSGQIIMQDKASMLAVEIAAENITDNHITVDVCASPGGKSLFAAEKFPDAKIISRDITEYKAGLIKENCRRLGIKNIYPQVHDALILDEELIEKADLVIADLPCSGLGVAGRKPDILYRVCMEDLESLKKLQQDILKVVQRYVKKGGTLVYSTCTVNKGENHDNTSWFLENFDFVPEKEVQYLPGIDDSDGFYIARFRKN